MYIGPGLFLFANSMWTPLAATLAQQYSIMLPLKLDVEPQISQISFENEITNDELDGR